METLLSHPAVQGGVAPFVVSLIATLLLPARLSGIAVTAAFATAVYFVAGFTFSPLTATRKIILIGLLAPVIGIVVDFTLRAARIGALVLALAGGVAALWVFWPLVSQKAPSEAWLMGGTAVSAAAFMVGFGQRFLVGDPVRACSAALVAGLAVGIASILSASASYGLYGIAVGAGAGGLLLVQMIRGRAIAAGATFMLPAMLIVALVGGGAMFLAQLPWQALIAIALIPVGARLPLPDKAPLWLKAMLLSFCCSVIGAVACALAWPE